ncbi:hypothetical protein E2C01_006951 [Portunus trituberculatus]|uniref:Uncharacterized protein n=1 Tax=Portunus trituberculatus TaxID=210409 RepID=A0A5B7CWT1_PORTR|nr:hypothetical protein [Portunus trituberculatus]
MTRTQNKKGREGLKCRQIGSLEKKFENHCESRMKSKTSEQQVASVALTFSGEALRTIKVRATCL